MSAVEGPPLARRRSPFRAARLALVTANRATLAGAVLLLLIAGLAVVGPLFYRFGPLAVNPDATLSPPSWQHIFGTDTFGRDVFARVIAAGRTDLLIPLLVVMLAASGGTVLGLLAGYFGTVPDQIIMRITDVLLAFPAFVLALVIVAVFGNGIPVLVAALSIANTPYFIRLSRSKVLAESRLEYVSAAVAVGNPEWRVALFHVLRNSLNPTLSQATLAFGWAILDTAGLAFLGVGIVEPRPEWGLMVGDGAKDVLNGVWWTSVLPGCFILVTVLAVNLVGTGLQKQRLGGAPVLGRARWRIGRGLADEAAGA